MGYRRTTLSLDGSFKRRVKYDIQGSVCQRCERFNPDPDIPMVVDTEGLAPGSPEPGIQDIEQRVIKDSREDYCEVRVTHHGAEEIKRIEMGSRTWGWKDLSQKLKLIRWFDPVDEIEQGRLVVPVNVQLVRKR